MLLYNFSFSRISSVISKWAWSELLFGLQNSLLTEGDVKDYALTILDDRMEHFDTVLKIVIEDSCPVKQLLTELSASETCSLDEVRNKWIFAIIFFASLNIPTKIYDVIEDVYAEFGYPKFLKPLVRYMPADDRLSLDEHLEIYVSKGKEKWCQ